MTPIKPTPKHYFLLMWAFLWRWILCVWLPLLFYQGGAFFNLKSYLKDWGIEYLALIVLNAYCFYFVLRKFVNTNRHGFYVQLVEGKRDVPERFTLKGAWRRWIEQQRKIFTLKNVLIFSLFSFAVSLVATIIVVRAHKL